LVIERRDAKALRLFDSMLNGIMTDNTRHMMDNFRQAEKGFPMLASLFGSKNAERVLIFLSARDEGYAREIARFFETDLKSIQQQLEKLEAAGVLSSREVGRTRPYTFNPRYPFLAELKNLLEKALTFYPEDEREKLIMNRRRPRGI
jgi:hypothetical protein